MKCDQINDYLDLLMDGALSDAQRLELEAHGQACHACAASIRATWQLKAMMEEMTPEADVPLAAQAAWRSAVRSEAGRKRSRRFYRIGSAAAAAVVVIAGVGWALNANVQPAGRSDASARYAAEETMEEIAIAGDALDADLTAEMVSGAGAPVEFAAAQSAVIEADGLTDESAVADEMDLGSAPAHEIAVVVQDLDAAARAIGDLVTEYEGSVDLQPIEAGGANLYVEMPAENVADFLEAIAHWHTADQPLDTPDVSGEAVSSLLIVLSEE